MLTLGKTSFQIEMLTMTDIHTDFHSKKMNITFLSNKVFNV